MLAFTEHVGVYAKKWRGDVNIKGWIVDIKSQIIASLSLTSKNVR